MCCGSGGVSRRFGVECRCRSSRPLQTPPKKRTPPHQQQTSAGNHHRASSVCLYERALEPAVARALSTGFELVNEGTPEKTKWGFVARRPGAALALRVDTTGGANATGAGAAAGAGAAVYVAYLKSYERMGVAEARCAFVFCVGRLGRPACPSFFACGSSRLKAHTSHPPHTHTLSFNTSHPKHTFAHINAAASAAAAASPSRSTRTTRCACRRRTSRASTRRATPSARSS